MKRIIKTLIDYFSFIKKILLIKKLKSKQKLALFISHDMSLSGAPIVLFNVINYYKSLGFTPVVVSLNYGSLKEQFNLHNITNVVLYNKNYILWRLIKNISWEFIFINTIVSLKVIDERLLNINCKKILWVHEGYEYFSNMEKNKYINDSRIDKYFVSDWSYCAYENTYNNLIKNPNYLRYSINNVQLQKVPQKYDFIIVGAICKRKNQNWLLKALSLLPKQILDNLSVLFVGKTNGDMYSKDFLKLINKYCWANYYGEASHKITLDLINESKFLVCPSIDDPLPVVVGESLMLGKPVLVSSKTGFKNLIISKKTGFVFNVENFESILKVVYEALQSNYYYENNCKELFNQLFNSNIFYDNLNKIIKK